MKKLVAILLTLAMVCSISVAALAADAATGDQTAFNASNVGATNVYILADSQLSVTVPIRVTLAIAQTGVITAPAITAYKIVNNSVFAVKVTGVAVTDTDPFETVASYSTGADKLTLTLKPGSGTAITLTDALSFTGNTAWNIAAKEGTTAGELGLLFAGSAHNLSAAYTGVTDGAATTQAFTITYTVAAGAYPTT